MSLTMMILDLVLGVLFLGGVCAALGNFFNNRLNQHYQQKEREYQMRRYFNEERKAQLTNLKVEEAFLNLREEMIEEALRGKQ